MNAVRIQVDALVDVELEAANAIHPPFSSLHEGYAVIKEELEEVEECVQDAKASLDELWLRIKKDAMGPMGQEAVMDIRQTAIFAACEAIQVAAMAQKLLDGLGGMQ